MKKSYVENRRVNSAFIWTLLWLSPFAPCMTPAHAQISSDIPPPRILMTDDQSVDPRSGQLVHAGNILTIGAAGTPALSYAALAFSGAADAGTPRSGGVYQECYVVSAHPCAIIFYHFKMGQRMERGQSDDSNRTTRDGSIWGETSTAFTLAQRDGTVYTFSKTLADPNYKLGGSWIELGKLVSITYPNGETLSYVYASNSVNYTRSITSSTGYQLHFEYASSYWPTRVALLNLAVDYCDPNASSCSNLTVNWPRADVSPSGTALVSAVDAQGRSATTTGWQSSGAQFFDPHLHHAGRPLVHAHERKSGRRLRDDALCHHESAVSSRTVELLLW